MKKLFISSAVALSLMVGSVVGVQAQASSQQTELKAKHTKDIHFKRGAVSGVYSGKVKGYDFDDYTFTARQGQQVKVDVLKNSSKIQAALLDSDGNNLNDEQGNPVIGYIEHLPSNGKYVVRILQSRNAARSNKTVTYRFKVTIK